MGLRQVLENLIDNAIRVTMQGEISLVVQPGAPERIGFRLSDSGPGLDPIRAEALLAADAPSRGKDRGLGLGIAAASWIVPVVGSMPSLRAPAGALFSHSIGR